MSQFNSYAQRLNDTAKELFKEYEDERDALTKAQQRRKEYGLSAAETARREGDLIEAQERYDAAMKTWADRGERTFHELRKDLAGAVGAAFIADPESIDQNTVTLLNSGICTSADYERLLKTANGNATMIRLILAQIEKVATSPDTDSMERRALNVLLNDGKAGVGRGIIEEFDAIGDVFHRCLQNPSMIPHWSNLTADAIDNF